MRPATFLPCSVLLATVLVFAAPAAAQRDGCREDPATSSEIVVAADDEPGERLVVTGRVLDPGDRSPTSGVRVRMFQTDAAGYYSAGGMDEGRARLCGVLETDDHGRYRIETILPGAYATGDGPEPHLHFDLTFPDGRKAFVTILVPEVLESGDPSGGDLRARTRPVVRTADGLLRVVADLQPR